MPPKSMFKRKAFSTSPVFIRQDVLMLCSRKRARTLANVFLRATSTTRHALLAQPVPRHFMALHAVASNLGDVQRAAGRRHFWQDPAQEIALRASARCFISSHLSRKHHESKLAGIDQGLEGRYTVEMPSSKQ